MSRKTPNRSVINKYVLDILIFTNMLILLYDNSNFLKKIYFNSIITRYVNTSSFKSKKKNTLNYMKIRTYKHIFSDKCQVPNKCFELVDIISEN